MAHVITRPSGRFTGYFRDSVGKVRSAGTFNTYEEALIRAKDLDGASPAPLKIKPDTPLAQYEPYVHGWLAQETDLNPRTRAGYESNLRVHILPLIGHLRVEEITTETIVMMLSSLKAKGVGPGVRAQCKAAVGRSFKPLVPHRIALNPTHGVRVDLPPPKKFNLLEPEDFQRISQKLPNEGCRLFAEFLVLSGARYGEATEIRPKDVDFRTREVEIVRRAIELTGRHNNGSRFQVLEGTKAGTQYGRTVVLPSVFMEDLQFWIASNHLDSDGLIFAKRLLAPWDLEDSIAISPGEQFRNRGYNYRHGTASGYTAGGCRCEDCRLALRQYRRELRRKNLAKRRNFRGENRTGHLANDLWRKIWRKAIKESGLNWYPRTHDLRHACATHMVTSGISIFEVKEILGHRNIETTLKYQHRVDRMKSKAVDAVGDFLGPVSEV